MSEDEGSATTASWPVRHAALVGVILIVVGLVVAIAGQRALTSESRPPKQYIDGRYWTIDPASCAALDLNSRGACIALDAAKAADDDRAHQNLVTVRAVGVFAFLAGFLLVFIGFSGTRRSAQVRSP